MASHPEERETFERLQALSPTSDVQPDVARAWAALLARRSRVRRRARVVMGVAAACLGAVMLPGPRALARNLWAQWAVGQLSVVETPGHVSEEVAEVFSMTPGPWRRHAVRDMEEAQALAGFRPILPPAMVLKGEPRLSVVARVTLSTRPLDVAAIERALAASGVADMNVPPEWQGLTLSAAGGPMVIADYDGISIMQLASFSLTVPEPLELGRFMELALRVFGRSASEAHELGARFEANPALLLHFPRETTVRELVLARGTGILVPNRAGRIFFFWNTPGRIFIADAEALSDSDAIALADVTR